MSGLLGILSSSVDSSFGTITFFFVTSFFTCSNAAYRDKVLAEIWAIACSMIWYSWTVGGSYFHFFLGWHHLWSDLLCTQLAIYAFLDKISAGMLRLPNHCRRLCHIGIPHPWPHTLTMHQPDKFSGALHFSKGARNPGLANNRGLATAVENPVHYCHLASSLLQQSGIPKVRQLFSAITIFPWSLMQYRLHYIISWDLQN